MSMETKPAADAFMWQFLNLQGVYAVPGRNKAPFKVRHWKDESASMRDNLDQFWTWQGISPDGAAPDAPTEYLIDCEKTGIVVIDCDADKETGEPVGEANFRARFGGVLDSMAGRLAVVETPSGGRHYYFKSETAYPSTASRLAPHVDVRSRGGLIACPGSIRGGRRYSPLFDLDGCDSVMDLLAPLPDEIAQALAPAKPEPANAGAAVLASMRPVTPGDRLHRWGFIERRLKAVRAAGPGARDSTLSRQAYSAFLKARESGMDVLNVADELYRAALETGLPPSEARATVASALRSVRGLA